MQSILLLAGLLRLPCDSPASGILDTSVYDTLRMGLTRAHISLPVISSDMCANSMCIGFRASLMLDTNSSQEFRSPVNSISSASLAAARQPLS